RGPFWLHALGPPAPLAGRHQHLAGARADIQQRAAAQTRRPLDQRHPACGHPGQVLLKQGMADIEAKLTRLAEHVPVDVHLRRVGVAIGRDRAAVLASAKLIARPQVEPGKRGAAAGRAGRQLEDPHAGECKQRSSGILAGVSGVAATQFYFERERLVGLARERAEAYRSAWPFPHAVIDDLIPPAVARACHEEFAQASREHWQLYTDAGNTRKLELSDETRMGPVSRHLVAQFNGRVMIEFLEELTGIRGLVGDPHLVGGGLHELGPGGFLRVHADFNIHPLLALDRRLNLLLYLNEDWDESWGGELEL